MRAHKATRPFTVTRADIADIKERNADGVTCNQLARDYRKFSTCTIAAIARGEYDDRAVAGGQPVLTDRRIAKLLAFPTPEQALYDAELADKIVSDYERFGTYLV